MTQERHHQVLVASPLDEHSSAYEREKTHETCTRLSHVSGGESWHSTKELMIYSCFNCFGVPLVRWCANAKISLLLVSSGHDERCVRGCLHGCACILIVLAQAHVVCVQLKGMCTGEFQWPLQIDFMTEKAAYKVYNKYQDVALDDQPVKLRVVGMSMPHMLKSGVRVSKAGQQAAGGGGKPHSSGGIRGRGGSGAMRSDRMID
jgi:hypothetical protein